MTACMASCGWADCWCHCCGSRSPWWRWAYVMGRHMLWTTNTGEHFIELKTSQFLHWQHTHRTCHPLSMFGMLWIGVYDSVFQYLPISSNFTQPLKWSGPTFNNQQPDQLYAKEMCWTAWGKWWSHQIQTGFQTTPPPPQYHKTANFRVAFYCGQPKAHLCYNLAV